MRRGRPSEVVAQVTAEAGASVVHANADVTPYGRRRDQPCAKGSEHLQHVVGQPGPPPGGVRTAKGRTSRVFTPFFGAWVQTALERWPEPGEATIAGDPGDGLPVCDTEPFQPGGEEEAISRLVVFSRRVDDYAQDRDVPARDGTSALSADLRFGTLAARTILATIGDSTHGRGCVHPPAGLAGLVRPPALGGAVAGRRGPSTGPEPHRLGQRPPRHRGMATGPNRLPDRRRRHAPARHHRVDAQPGAYDRRLLPRQRPAGGLADRRAMVPAAPRRRRHRPERRQLAVGGRHRPRTPRPTFVSSTRCANHRSSTPPAPTSASSYPNWRQCRPDGFTPLGWRRPSSWHR